MLDRRMMVKAKTGWHRRLARVLADLFAACAVQSDGPIGSRITLWSGLHHLMWAGLPGINNLVWRGSLFSWQAGLLCKSTIMTRMSILKSSALCVQVYWLLNAIAQDHPKLKGAAELRDSCEQAALEGYWVRRLQGVWQAHAAGSAWPVRSGLQLLCHLSDFVRSACYSTQLWCHRL